MKVYIVEGSSGSWGDASRYTRAVFAHEKMAFQFVARKNAQIDRLQLLSSEFFKNCDEDDDIISNIGWNRHYNISELNHFMVRAHEVTFEKLKK